MSEPKQPVIPNPDKIRDQIEDEVSLAHEEWANHLTRLSQLRRQLKLSCECYGEPYADPSARKKIDSDRHDPRDVAIMGGDPSL